MDVAETKPLIACSGPVRVGARVNVPMVPNVDELVMNDE